MPWFGCRCSAADSVLEAQRFAAFFERLGRPRGMMMVSTAWGDPLNLYIGLPDPRYAEEFPQFRPVPQPPPIGRGLVGRECDLAGFRPPARDTAA